MQPLQVPRGASIRGRNMWLEHLRGGIGRHVVLFLLGLLLAIAITACSSDDQKTDESASATETSSSASPAGSATATGAATPLSASASSSITATATSTRTARVIQNTGTAAGNAFARNALLVAQDLPGSGWTVSKEDEEESVDSADDPEVSDKPACRAYANDFIAPTVHIIESSRVGRAEKEFTESGTVNTLLTIEVAVFEDDNSAQRYVMKVKEGFEGGYLERCWRELFTGDKYNITSASTLTGVPRNGAATAINLGVTTSGVTVQRQWDFFSWANGNVVVDVNVLGSYSIVADVEKVVISKTEDKLSKAR